MILLRLASLVAAVTTIVLNAHAGYISASTPEYAVLFAALSTALDVAKCSLISAGVTAFRRRALLIGIIAFALFPLVFAYSVWNAVSQVTKSRETASAGAIADRDAHARAEATYKRLSNELALMQANPTFAATASCTLPKSKMAHTFCAGVAQAKAGLAAAEAALAQPAAADPSPQLTLLAAITGARLPELTLTLNVIPVLLAELLGSLGFVIAATGSKNAPQPAPSPSRLARLWSVFSKARLPRWRTNPKNPPAAVPAAPATASSVAAAPKIQWSMKLPS